MRFLIACPPCHPERAIASRKDLRTFLRIKTEHFHVVEMTYIPQVRFSVENPSHGIYSLDFSVRPFRT